MLNKIWFWLLLIGILYGFGKAAVRQVSGSAAVPTATGDAGPEPGSAIAAHRPAEQPLRAAGQDLTNAALEAAKSAVELCIVLIGLMALWLGMLHIARDAGLMDALAGALRPVLHALFPDVPDGHPAQGAMLMNIAANMLGLGNAATPFGLKAMRELQTLNPNRQTATNAMAMFLAINTSSVTLIPFTIIGLRVAAGSRNAAAPLAGILLVTTLSTAVAIIASRVLSRLPRYSLPRRADLPTADSDTKQG